MSARERRPHHAVPVDVHAPRSIPRQRRLEDLGQSSRRGIRSRVDADDVAGESEDRAPDGAVGGVHGDAVEGGHDPLVLGGIDGLVRLDVVVPLAVAVGVEDERRPALRSHLVTGLVEHLAIQPAEYAALRPARARPQRVVGVLREYQMVGGEARTDQGDLPRLGIVPGEMPVGLLDREELGRRMVRSLLAEVRIRGRTHARGEPDPPLLVKHRVVHARLAVPDRVRPPVRRRRRGVLVRRGRVGITHEHPDLRRLVLHGIEHREEIRALLGSAVDHPVGVDPRVALVRRDLVVQVVLGAGPVPERDDDVALHSLRPGRRGRRELARGDSIGPVGEERGGPLGVEPPEIVQHLRHGLPRHDAPGPRLRRGGELAELLRNRARRLVAELVTRVAAVGLDDVEPLRLALEGHRDAVTARAGAGELALVRHLEHGIPVDRRVVLGRRRRARRHGRLQIDQLAGNGTNLGRVDEPVAADPDPVGRLGKIGQDIAAPIIGDHDLGKLRGQVGRLGDDPHAPLRPVRACDHAAEVPAADADRRVGALRAQSRLARSQEHHDAGCHQPEIPPSGRFHVPAPLMPPDACPIRCGPPSRRAAAGAGS